MRTIRVLQLRVRVRHSISSLIILLQLLLLRNIRHSWQKITTYYVPKTYKEAVKDPRFNGAMKSEIAALEDNYTWDVTHLPQGKRAISCRWLYSNKYRADGTLERPKARLVACGNRQKKVSITKILLHRWLR